LQNARTKTKKMMTEAGSYNPQTLKSFLDTSIVYKTQLGTSLMKRQLLANVPKAWYINNYVQMEFFRGNLSHWIYLYFESKEEKYETFGDAFKLYSEGFGRQAKNAVAVLTTIEMDGVSFAKPEDKQLCREKLQDFIYERAIDFADTFTDTGTDPTHCARIKFKLKIPNDADERVSQLQSFAYHFRDEVTCRSKCSISELFTRASHRAKIDAIAEATAEGDTKEKLEKIQAAIEKSKQNPAKITCKRCSKMGDAIIAVALDSSWKLHSMDSVHQSIASALKLQFQTHPSEQALAKQ